MSAPSPSESTIVAAADSQPVREPVDQRRDSGGSLSDSKPPTAADQTAGDDEIQSDADATPSPAAIASLHRHALESVLAFLGLRDLAAAMRVSRGWLAAVGSMRRLELEVRRPSASALVEMAWSAMGRHVSSLWTARLDAETLAAVTERMAHLRRLHGLLQLPPAAGPLAFPANLRRLEIHLAGPSGVADIGAAIAAISQLPLLDDLIVTLSALDRLVSFGPLSELPLLRRLSIIQPRSQYECSDSQIDELRALPQLQPLYFGLALRSLRRLLRQPHNLQWRQISLPFLLDDETAALLPQLPSLTQIEQWTTCSRFDWLAQLPSLAVVYLAFHSRRAAATAGPAESLVAGLQLCPTIEILTLDNFADLTAAQLADLLPRLPRLRELSLNSLLIDSLSFLAQPPLTSQLSRLELVRCMRLPLADLRHVHSLRGLKKLKFLFSFSAPLDDHGRALLTPPSSLLPLLEQFDCGQPTARA